VRLSVVGCGAAAEHFHLPAACAVVGRENVWLVDPDRARARELARRFGRTDHVATATGEVAAEVDAAVVAVPNDLHASVASELLEAGVHVLCEKPLGRTAAEAREIAETAKRTGSTLAVGHFRRFFPSSRLVGDLISRGACGSPTHITAVEGFADAWSSRSLFPLDRERAGGGVLLDLGSHVLDLLLFWFGDLEAGAYRDDAHGGVEADCAAELTGDGLTASVELSRTRDLGSTVRITCQRGAIEAPLARAGRVKLSAAGEMPQELGEEAPDGGWAVAFEDQLRDFLGACAESREPATTGQDAVRLASLVDDCYECREPLDEPWVFETLSRG
jgi:predicted dehydrogenase